MCGPPDTVTDRRAGFTGAAARLELLLQFMSGHHRPLDLAIVVGIFVGPRPTLPARRDAGIAPWMRGSVASRRLASEAKDRLLARRYRRRFGRPMMTQRAKGTDHEATIVPGRRP